MHRFATLALFALSAPRVAIPISNESEGPDARTCLLSALPERALVSVDGSGLAEVLGNGLADPLIEGFLDTDLGRLWGASAKNPEALLALLEHWLDGSPTETLRSLTASGLVLAWYGEERGVVLAGRGPDEHQVVEAIDVVLAALGRQVGAPEALLRPRDGSDGVQTWILGEARLVRRGETWVLGQDETLVRATLDRSPGDGDELVASSRARGLVAHVDLEALVESGNPGIANLRREARMPGFRFVLGDALASLASSTTLTARVDLLADGLHVELEGGDPPQDEAVGEPIGPIVPSRGDDLAFAVLHRDVARWVRDRVALFPPESLPAFSEALGNAMLFAGGRDVEQEVLPGLSPWWTVLVRQPEFEFGATPAVDLPGAAVIVPVRTADAGQAWVEAFQTVVAVSNVEAAQQGRRGFRLELERRGETTITRARPGAAGRSERKDLRDNLEPAVASGHGCVILATHVSLVREVLDRLESRPNAPAEERIERGAIDLAGVAELVGRHRSVLELSKRLEEGLSADDAAREIEGLRSALASFGRLVWRVECPGPVVVNLDLSLRMHGEPR